MVLLIYIRLLFKSISFHCKANASPTLSPRLMISKIMKKSLLQYSFVVLYFSKACSLICFISPSVNENCVLVSIWIQLSFGIITPSQGFLYIISSCIAFSMHGRMNCNILFSPDSASGFISSDDGLACSSIKV